MRTQTYINATNRALNELRKITYEDKTFVREPHISDYYEPSKEMEDYQTVVIGFTGFGTGWIISKLVL